MGQPAIVFESVWKKFRRGERHDSLRDVIPSLIRGFARRRAATDLTDVAEFWALRDVSFEVHPGEALGIIGPNGAGKSTTLKLLTKILKPTRGRALLRGRVGALIEVAAGFHPDLTGRENIFLQGAIMGMKRAEIAQKLDAIIEFAGVTDFIDTPVKRYSSGMNARLGFAIAAHMEPEVLVIDEVLSVGDMTFQQRCVARMKEFKRSGVAIVFVSHNLQAVATLCDHALFLKREALALGPVESTVRKYLETQNDNSESTSTVTISQPRLTNVQGIVSEPVRPGDPLALEVMYSATVDVSDVTFCFLVYRSTDNLIVYDGNFLGRELGQPDLQAGQGLAVRFDFQPHLTRGQYHIVCHVLHNPTQHALGTLAPAAWFSVDESRTHEGVADLTVRAARVNEAMPALAGLP